MQGRHREECLVFVNTIRRAMYSFRMNRSDQYKVRLAKYCKQSVPNETAATQRTFTTEIRKHSSNNYYDSLT